MNLERLIAALKGDEGFRPLVYDDANGQPVTKGDVLIGYPTIGYGWNLSSDPITEAEATDRLTRRAIQALRDAADLVPSWVLLDDVRANVLANMAYNLGKTGLSKFKNMLAAVERKAWDEAADQMKDSAWYKQVGVRAKRLEKQMRTGEWI